MVVTACRRTFISSLLFHWFYWSLATNHLVLALALSPQTTTTTTTNHHQQVVGGTPTSSSSLNSCLRRDVFRSIVPVAAAAFGLFPQLAQQAAASDDTTTQKLKLSDSELKEVVKKDILEGQFLVTGKLTPSVYLPTATFTDEIDTYGLEQWQKGTSRLFVAEGSSVRLVGDVVCTPDRLEFRFDEDLMFNVPLLRPVVALTGKVVLTRDPGTGYISSYQEFWDQDVNTVLKSAKFGTKI